MTRRFGLFGVCVVSSVCVLLLLVSHQLSGYSQRQQPDFRRNIQSLPDLTEASGQNGSWPTIKEVVAQQRLQLEQELASYPFPAGESLDGYAPSSGGRPLRNIIITTWRSGSTFLGEIINTVPGNYYHYEPLLNYDIVQIRGPPFGASALDSLKQLLRCQYSNMNDYLEYGRGHLYLFTHNTRLWEQCLQYPQYCFNATFLSELCSLFPFQSMKIVRLRLRLAEELLSDDSLNVRVLLLVRDPRGTLQSRKHREWCPGQPDCDQPGILCADMVSDYTAALRLKRLYPGRFRAIRYEDFSLDPYLGMTELLQFFRLQPHPNVRDFLDRHTHTNAGGVSSTFRNSRSAPFHWRMDLNFSEVRTIEAQCSEAMSLWGYVRAHNESSLKKLNPLAEFSLSHG